MRNTTYFEVEYIGQGLTEKDQFAKEYVTGELMNNGKPDRYKTLEEAREGLQESLYGLERSLNVKQEDFIHSFRIVKVETRVTRTPV